MEYNDDKKDFEVGVYRKGEPDQHTVQGDTKFQYCNSNYLCHSTIINGPGGLTLKINGVRF